MAADKDFEYADPEIPLPVCKAICLYDFLSEDPVSLSFKQGDLLSILSVMRKGWAGVRRDETEAVGWVPAEYLAPLPDETAACLESIKHERVRYFEYEAEVRYRKAPVRDLNVPSLRRVKGTRSLFNAFGDLYQVKW